MNCSVFSSRNAGAATQQNNACGRQGNVTPWDGHEIRSRKLTTALHPAAALTKKVTVMPPKKTSSKKSRGSSGKKARGRELIEPKKGDKRFVRRSKTGQFKNVVDVGRSLSADKRRSAKKKVPKGQGDRGDT
jgi:hypothetical protein